MPSEPSNNDRRRSRRVLTILAAAGALGVVVVGAIYWQDIAAWLRFYRLFEYAGVNEQGYPEYRHRQTGIVMVRVPGGTFVMGTSWEEEESVVAELNESVRKVLQRERPQHKVTLRPFLIKKCEVTQAEWRTVMTDDPSHFKGDSLPVEGVSWDNCKEFLRNTQLSFPTEAQWEFACRAGTEGAFAGTGNRDDIGWYEGNSGGTTHPVGQKQPNAFGLYDMHGNVWEWCKDVFDGRFYSRPEARGPDPVAMSGSEDRVIRGGGWDWLSVLSRSAFRFKMRSSKRSSTLGLRPAFWPLPPGL